MSDRHPLTVRQWLYRVEQGTERKPRRQTGGSVLLVSTMVALALAALFAAVTQ